jgi:glucose/arabinose dehydrogenase
MLSAKYRFLFFGLSLGLAGAFLFGMLNLSQTYASLNGRINFSGNPATSGGATCTTCHGAGAAVPSVVLAGPALVEAGSTHVYTLTITGGPAQTAGLGVSTSGFAGQLIAGPGSQIISNELTHLEPLPFTGNTAVFTYSWTAPATDQTVTMYAAGNSTNASFSPLGDGINTTTLEITVQNGGGTPTPTPSPTPPAHVITTTFVVWPGDTLTVTNPIVTNLTHAGDSRLFFTEKSGYIYIIDNDTIVPTPYLDITDRVYTDSASEEGLLGLAFHPDYADNGYFFVNYTTLISGTVHTRISRFSVSANPHTADPHSEHIILEFAQPYPNHNGGALLFGQDGYLYISSGDGGPADNGQNETVLLGKILRLDVDNTIPTGNNGPDCDVSGNAHYTIPADNAYGDGAGGNCDEIWQTGFRNPWRMSIDRVTGDFWITDVGQQEWEEIYFLPAGTAGGLNFGWPCYEGFVEDPLNLNLPACTGNTADYTFPLHVYDHQREIAPSQAGMFIGERPRPA